MEDTVGQLPENSPASPPSGDSGDSAASHTQGAQAFTHWKRNIALYLVGQSLSLFGSAIVQFAIMWHLTLMTKSAWILTLFALVAFLPQGAITLFGGTLADRMDRKLLIIVPDALIAAATLALAVIMYRGEENLALILTVVFLRSVGAGFQTPAVGTLIPSMVPERELMRVNGINSTSQSLIGILAPVAGGALYGIGGIQPTLLVDVVTAIVAIVILVALPIRTLPPERDKETFFKELIEGLRYTKTHRFILWLVNIIVTIMLLVVGPTFLIPLLITQKFGGTVWDLTIFEMSFQIGTVVGGIGVSSIWARQSTLRMFSASALIFGVLTIVQASSPWVWGVFVSNLMAGFFVPLFVSPAMTEIQKRVDPAYLGRVNSQLSLTFTLVVPASMALFGPLSEAFGVAPVVGISGAVSILIIAVALFGTATGRREAWK